MLPSIAPNEFADNRAIKLEVAGGGYRRTRTRGR
jgi:hypothetical protein